MMTLDPGPAYAEPTTAEARAERNAQINNLVDDILRRHAEICLHKIHNELRREAPECLLNGLLVERVHAVGKSMGYKRALRTELAPYLAECLREFVMTLDERVEDEG